MKTKANRIIEFFLRMPDYACLCEDPMDKKRISKHLRQIALLRHLGVYPLFCTCKSSAEAPSERFMYLRSIECTNGFDLACQAHDMVQLAESGKFDVFDRKTNPPLEWVCPICNNREYAGTIYDLLMCDGIPF